MSSISSIFNNIISGNPSNVSLDKSKGGIMTYGGGFTHPLTSFKSYGLNKNNKSILENKLEFKNEFSDIIKTSQYRSFRTINQSLAQINPIEQKLYRSFTTMNPIGFDANTPQYENIFSPSAQMLVNINNYRFKYNTKIITFYTRSKDNDAITPFVTKLDGTPSLFNPLYVVQTKGIMPNVPLLNNDKTTRSTNEVDLTNCSIRELVRLSHINGSILGLARYRYSDFMYCRDVGKISNNHLITLRRFPIPIGDNIFEYYDEAPGDIGRLVTWFDNEENKLEDILKYEYKATWKELHAERQDIDSREEDQARGPLGILMNTISQDTNKQVAAGTAGGHNIFSKLGVGNPEPLDIQQRRELLRMYDKNKVYTPKNTIQDTHIYEGKLEFTHEFTLTFNYVIRGYDNINPRTALLDLIANILNVTYKRGVFWGGERRIIGPRSNVAGWRKATSMIDGAWEKAGTVFASIQSGASLSDVFGTIGSMFSNLFKLGLGKLKEAMGIGEGEGQGIGNAISGGLNKVTQLIKYSGLTEASLGVLKNTLGRPAVYAMDSLLTGDDVGLWHVTIGNPKNPIMAMGNLILTNASIEHYGPLGIDDFPTNLKLTVTLKHARSRDSVDIARMYTSGTNGIYYPVHNKDITTVFPNYMGNDVKKYQTDQYSKANKIKEDGSIDDETQTITGYANDIDMNPDNRVNELNGANKSWTYEKTYTDESANITTEYAAQIDHTNQKLMYDLALVLDEIA